MIREYKTKLVFKMFVLLIAFVLSVGLLLGVTYCRYLTQKNINVEYYAKSAPSIYMGSTVVKDDTLFVLSQWQTTLNQTSADFTLANTLGDNASPHQDIMFCVYLIPGLLCGNLHYSCHDVCR